MSFAVQLRAAARLDFAEVLRSRWIWFCVATYAVLAGVLLTVGVRESSILGFTGTSHVLLSFSHALILVLPLIALMALAPAVQRAREDGSLELLFSQPLSPGAWFLAVCGVRYLALVIPLAGVMVGIGVWGQVMHDDPIPWDFIGRSLAVSCSLLLAFAGIGAAVTRIPPSGAGGRDGIGARGVVPAEGMPRSSSTTRSMVPSVSSLGPPVTCAIATMSASLIPTSSAVT